MIAHAKISAASLASLDANSRPRGPQPVLSISFSMNRQFEKTMIRNDNIIRWNFMCLGYIVLLDYIKLVTGWNLRIEDRNNRGSDSLLASNSLLLLSISSFDSE